LINHGSPLPHQIAIAMSSMDFSELEKRIKSAYPNATFIRVQDTITVDLGLVHLSAARLEEIQIQLQQVAKQVAEIGSAMNQIIKNLFLDENVLLKPTDCFGPMLLMWRIIKVIQVIRNKGPPDSIELFPRFERRCPAILPGRITGIVI